MLHRVGQNSMGLDHVFLCRPSHLSLPGYIKLMKIRIKTQRRSTTPWCGTPKSHGRFETKKSRLAALVTLFQNLSLYLCLPIFHLWTFQGWKSLRRIERWQFTGPFFQLRFGLVLGGLGTLATFLKHCKLHTREIHSIVLIILISSWQTAHLSSTLVDLAFPQAPPFMAVRGPPKVLSKFVINWTWTVCEFVMNARCLTFIRTASCVSSCDVWAPECH